MKFIVKVSKKGQIVIPVEIRRRFNIRDKVVIEANDREIKIIPLIPLEELFGVDDDVMKDIAKEIVKERLEEIKHEK